MSPSYRALQLYALAISIISVIYNGAEGAVSIAFGAESSSRSLIFFGIQSGIEVASAAIVVWRFRSVAKPGEERAVKLDPRNLRFEKRSTLVIGILMLVLGLGTIATATSILILHERPEANNSSLIISASALVIMIFIWLPKRYLARELNSSAMQGEATCSLSCIQITIVLFIGSLIYRTWRGGWWIDGATSILLGLLFWWEGVKIFRWARDPEFDGGCCGSCRSPRQDVELGKGESQRDICKCCLEKEECSRADQCQCSINSASIGEEVCCTPIKANGEKCCTREITLAKIQMPNVSCCENAQEDCCSSPTKSVPLQIPAAAHDNDFHGHDRDDYCLPAVKPIAPPKVLVTEEGEDKNTCGGECCGTKHRDNDA